MTHFKMLSFALSGVVLIFSALFAQAQTMEVSELTARTSTGAHKFSVEIADELHEHMAGLDNRATLDANAGMLFYFPVVREFAIWTKKTAFPVDIVIIKPDWTVRRIVRNATPFSENIISSGGLSLGALQFRAGTAARIRLKPGDRLSVKGL